MSSVLDGEPAPAGGDSDGARARSGGVRLRGADAARERDGTGREGVGERVACDVLTLARTGLDSV